MNKIGFILCAAEAAGEGAPEGFPWTNLLICIGVIAAVIIVMKLLKSSIKWLIRVAINAVIGCALLYVFSLIPSVGFTLVWWHAIVTGLFGIPGAIILIVLHFIL